MKTEKGKMVMDEVVPSKITPRNAKRVCLEIRNGSMEYVWLKNVNGVTESSWMDGTGKDREMLQNRSAFDAMVNSLLVLMGMRLEGVDYMEEEE